jgi:hypothetical protein
MAVPADHATTPAERAPTPAPAVDRIDSREGHVPAPPSDRGAWLLALALGLIGIAVLLTTLLGAGTTDRRRSSPPAVVEVAATPSPNAAASPGADAGTHGSVAGTHGAAGSSAHATRSARARHAIVARPTREQQQLEAARFVDSTQTHIATRWLEGFYPIYETAQRTFGVDWLLLASIHRQESAFSTAPGTYVGLNFAHAMPGGRPRMTTRRRDTRRSTTTSTRSWAPHICCRPTAPDTRSTRRRGTRPTTTTATTRRG